MGGIVTFDPAAFVAQFPAFAAVSPDTLAMYFGMAESFVNTFKRDYVARMDLSDARTVLAQLPAAFEHFNEAHPHSSLKMRSPREFRRQQAAGAEQALYCE